jgi:hypothetical protein
MRHVVAHRLLADVQFRCDRGVAQPPRHEREDFTLARRQRGERGLRRLGRRDAKKIEHRVAEPRPRRLVLEQHVVLRVELHELRARDARGEPFAFGERRDLVVARVNDQRRNLHLGQQVVDVDPAARIEQLARDRSRRRLRAHLVEPADLLVARGRYESRREHLPERRVVAAPAEVSQIDDRAVLSFLVGIPAPPHAARVAAVQHHARDALRVLHRVAHARGRALRDAQQRDRKGWRRRVDDRFEILEPPRFRQVGRVPIRHPAPPLVVADEAKMRGEEVDPVPPDGALPLVFEVREPVRRLYEHGAAARLRPRESHAVRRKEVLDPLAARHYRSWDDSGTNVPVAGPDCIQTGTEFPFPRGAHGPTLWAGG